jgi:putative ribosome biogenesis GTPase RsgA
VRQAVEDGLIAEERYRAYMKLKAENAYNKNVVDYFTAEKMKFKQIAKFNEHNYK